VGLPNLGARRPGRKHVRPRAIAQAQVRIYHTVPGANRISHMSAPPAMPKTVLIVEDDPSATYIFDAMLTHAGYRSVTVSTGHDALRRISEVLPDLIIVDLGLPGDIDGFDLTAAVRREHSLELPILVVTVHAFPRDMERAWEAGCTAFMSKPVAPTVVVDKIRELIGPSE
jgi:two-component system, cell cycle response regulator DivK